MTQRGGLIINLTHLGHTLVSYRVNKERALYSLSHGAQIVMIHSEHKTLIYFVVLEMANRVRLATTVTADMLNNVYW